FGRVLCLGTSGFEKAELELEDRGAHSEESISSGIGSATLNCGKYSSLLNLSQNRGALAEQLTIWKLVKDDLVAECVKDFVEKSASGSIFTVCIEIGIVPVAVGQLERRGEEERSVCIHRREGN
ncbi:hypothetical protein PFISCL1PPCAC_21838, partial [Pristionchus fissidentatus]